MGLRLMMMRSRLLIVIIVVIAVSLDRHVYQLEAAKSKEKTNFTVDPKQHHHHHHKHHDIQHELYESKSSSSSPYLFPSTFLQDYKKMMSTFKIYPYNINDKINPEQMTTMMIGTSCSSSLFHTSLFLSRNRSSGNSFLTGDPNIAHLFFLPIFQPEMSPRSLADALNSLRISHPYWNRSLGADHLFLSSTPLRGTHRNVVELRKNALQITCFRGNNNNNNNNYYYFVPHKDVSLPPYPTTKFLPTTTAQNNNIKNRRLGYFKWSEFMTAGQQQEAADHQQPEPTAAAVLLSRLLKEDPDFVIETELSDEGTYVEMMETSRFCLFAYASGEVAVGLAEAMAYGCVPVIITTDANVRPLNNMPLAGVLSWQDMAVFTSISTSTGTLDVERFKKLLVNKDYPLMRRLVLEAAKHLLWNEPPRPYDAFHMVMYQLWTRRHAVRYY